MRNIVLLGDSILDNGAYTNGGPDVAAQLRELVDTGDEVTSLAVDGDVTADIQHQLKRMPKSATHLVVSVGGNDALGHADFLGESADSTAQVLSKLGQIAREFRAAHRNALESVTDTGLPLAICTIYDANFSDPKMAELVVTALALFNDAIIRNAIEMGAPIFDLRAICSERSDFANAIEPSSQGGAKIANAIWRGVQNHPFERKLSAIYPR